MQRTQREQIWSAILRYSDLDEACGHVAHGPRLRFLDRSFHSADQSMERERRSRGESQNCLRPRRVRREVALRDGGIDAEGFLDGLPNWTAGQLGRGP